MMKAILTTLMVLSTQVSFAKSQVVVDGEKASQLTSILENAKVIATYGMYSKNQLRYVVEIDCDQTCTYQDAREYGHPKRELGVQESAQVAYLLNSILGKTKIDDADCTRTLTNGNAVCILSNY